MSGQIAMQKQIAKFLEGVGFKGLALTKGEGNTYTFKFVSADIKGLIKTYGQPTLAGKGTVKVFNCKPYGRIGISDNGFVRMVYEARVEEEFKDKSHLGDPNAMPYTPALKLLFDRATISLPAKLKYLTAAWTHFNKIKFQNRMEKPRLACGPQPDFGGPKYRKAYGLYQGGFNFGPGNLWINEKLFNSDIDFVNAIIVHEMCITGDALIPTDVGLVRMSQIEKAGEFVANGLVIHNCHQSVWVLDNVKDPSQGGHGPAWQSWMRRVGLPPERYDNTDQALYMTDEEKAQKDQKANANWGSPMTAVEMKSYEAISQAQAKMFSPVYLMYDRRFFVGDIKGNEFRGVPLKKSNTFKGTIAFSVSPKAKLYRKKA